MPTAKRILTVTVKRMMDDSPDTSHMGEYSDKRENEYSIDRKHDADCAINDGRLNAALTTFDHALRYVEEQRTVLSSDESDAANALYGAYDEAGDILSDIISELEDGEGCSCGGAWIDRNSYRYFNPSSNYVDANGKPTDGNTPEMVREYVAQDYSRMEELNMGFWLYTGVAAEAEIVVNGILQTVSSGGLWGIESDSDASYFAEVEGEQLSELKGQLEALGFGKRAISKAFQDVQREEE